MKETALEDLDLSVFASLVNSTFFVRQESGDRVELVLAEAKPVHAAGARTVARTRCFSLVFQGPDRLFLPQKIHTFEHASIGRFALFIVPVGQKQGCVEYQAVFNRPA
jgi:hypothetical protein